VQDWYEGAPAVITANICLPLGVGNGTTVHAIRILFPETVTFTLIEVFLAGGCIIVQLARYMLRFIVLQVRDGQGPSPQIPGPTDGQFFYMLPQIQALFVTLLNRRICLQLRCGMTGKEQHLQLPHSLTSIKGCCNSRSTSPLARIVLPGHKAQGITMAYAFVTGLHRVTLQWQYSIASKAL